MSYTGALLVTFLASPGGLGSAARHVTASFPSAGITTVVLRASAAADASVAVVGPKVTSIKVSGTPAGGAKGYHSPDPNWKETSPTEWGLGFVARPFGATLVISSKNEIQYIHHRYTLESIHIDVPPGVAVVREPRRSQRRWRAGPQATHVVRCRACHVHRALDLRIRAKQLRAVRFGRALLARHRPKHPARSTKGRPRACRPRGTRSGPLHPRAWSSVAAGPLRSHERLHPRARGHRSHRSPSPRSQRLCVAELGPPSCPSLTLSAISSMPSSF